MSTRIIIIIFALFTTLGLSQQPKQEITKPDFYTYDADGTVKTQGVYETDEMGRVTKFTVYDGGKKLKYTELPFYASDGRLVRADRLDSEGKLSKVVVYFDTFLKVLDKDGKVIDTQGYSAK